jgi:hypothetical protein
MRAASLTPVVLALGLLTVPAGAFPDMVRHGYVNCTTCHVAPNGGGALTTYGRELSKEVLSTWSTENEHLLLQGAVSAEDLPSWVNTVGGDFRGIQIHREDSFVRSGRWIWMQADAELGLRYEGFKLNASVGRVAEEDGVRIALRKAYLSATLAPGQAVRVGRFTPAYGLNIAEHTSYIKQDLGLGARSETDNIEYSWMNEDWNYFATATWPTQELAQANADRRFLQQLSYNVASRYKFGLQHQLVASDAGNQQVYGAHALLGFTDHAYALAEVDFNTVLVGGASVNGRVDYVKAGYEIFQGFHLQATRETAQPNLVDDLTSKMLWGGGLVWYPRPHWELQLVWNKVQMRAFGDEWSDVGWLLLHYYL